MSREVVGRDDLTTLNSIGLSEDPQQDRLVSKKAAKIQIDICYMMKHFSNIIFRTLNLKYIQSSVQNNSAGGESAYKTTL